MERFSTRILILYLQIIYEKWKYCEQAKEQKSRVGNVYIFFKINEMNCVSIFCFSDSIFLLKISLIFILFYSS